MQHAIFVLLVAALLVMAATLALVFRTRLRLLPLALALAAAGLTFGALSLAGGSLTMASVAVLPVLIGLAVDYAIQFQARFDEQRLRSGRPAREPAAAGRGGRRPDDRSPPASRPPSASWCSCCRRCRWCAASACCWSLGIVLALACALCAGFAALVRFGAPASRHRRRCRALRARLAGARRTRPRSSRLASGVATRAWRALGVGAGAAAGACWPIGARGGGGRPGGGHADQGRSPTSATSCRQTCQALRDVNDAAEGDGRVGRDRRDRARRATSPTRA